MVNVKGCLHTRIYLFTDRNGFHWCVDYSCVCLYRDGLPYDVSRWTEITPHVAKLTDAEKLEKIRDLMYEDSWCGGLFGRIKEIVGGEG